MPNLNEQQKEIVDFINGKAIVIACPGSGKTTTMISRANNMVKSGISEEDILIITFTKEATKNMKKKYEREFGKTKITFSTIHSLCFSVLSRERGLTKENIITEIQKWEYIGKLISNKIPFSEREEFIKGILAEISYIKNKMTDPRDYKSTVCESKYFCELYQKYESYKEANGLIDFDDMLLQVREMLYENDEIACRYALRPVGYSHIMVDEYQDTNRCQADIIYKLAEISAQHSENSSLLVVGDDDQSIYAFRSADSSIMLDFPKKFPECKKFFLDINYRSEPKIIEYASNLIKKNKVRFEKDFKTAKKGEATIELYSCESTSDETARIVHCIESLKATEELSEIAVLCRTNKEHQQLASKLLKKEIPFYTTDKMPNMYEDRAFLDIKCYYRLAVGKEMKNDFVSILNRPSRYVKKELFENCKFNKKEILERCKKATNKERVADAMCELFVHLEQLKKRENPSEFIDYLYNRVRYSSGYEKYMEFLGKDSSEALTILEDLENEAKNYDTMEEWFSYADQYGELLKNKQQTRQGICLTTYHSSKGLEWDNVILPNCNEDFTPHKKCETEEELEEERRLFYVAFTRARKAVYSFYLNSCGSKTVSVSMFLIEMGLKKSIIKEDMGTAEGKIFYGVRCGRTPGVYTTWSECLKQVENYKGAIYKKFNTYKDATEFVNAEVLTKKWFYVVRKGKKPGIYENWKDCETQIKGYTGAVYRKFNDLEEARHFFRYGRGKIEQDGKIDGKE